MNRTPDQQPNSNQNQQNAGPQQRSVGQNGEQNNGNRRYNMTPEQREEYIRRFEARKRAENERERPKYRRRKRVNINLGLTIFLVVICIVSGISGFQIAKNSKMSGGENKLPGETGTVVESGDSDDTDVVPGETKNPSETAPTETAVTELDVLLDTRLMKSSDINKGDLILVNNDYEYPLADKVTVVGTYAHRHDVDFKLSGSALSLTEKTFAALRELSAALASETGCDDLLLNSAYRTLEDQQEIYDKNVRDNGEEYARQYVANPGFSEHHTGMACDFQFMRDDGSVVSVQNHEYGGWLTEHCAEYGFILRYPEEKAYITGISYEPWHFRYVGKPHAAVVMKKDLCFEEYIGLLKEYTLNTKILHIMEDGSSADVTLLSIPNEGYVVYYVPASSEENTEIKIPKGYENVSISGNNMDGFIVTVYVGQ